MNVVHSWQLRRMMIRKEQRLLKIGPSDLKWKSIPRISIVMVVNLREDVFSITAKSVK